MLVDFLGQIPEFTPSLIVTVGFVIGLQHALEPDHIAAMSSQISVGKTKQKSNRNLITSSTIKSSILGAFWGAGHATSLIMIGLLMYVLSISIDQKIFFGFEIMVGFMLIFLGVTTISRKFHRFQHRHPHNHADGSLHFEVHDHTSMNHYHNHKSYLIGLMHGLAGSGSIVALTSVTLNNIDIFIWFILVFSLGSILGMIIISGFLGIPFVFGAKISKLQKVFRYTSSALCFILGINIIFQIILMNNLVVF